MEKNNKVEPLQNGEREEELLELLDELKDNIRSQPEVIKFKASYQPIIDYMNRLLSQSKKEGYLKGIAEEKLRHNAIEFSKYGDGKSRLSGGKPLSYDDLESLTNQKKVKSTFEDGVEFNQRNIETVLKQGIKDEDKRLKESRQVDNDIKDLIDMQIRHGELMGKIREVEDSHHPA